MKNINKFNIGQKNEFYNSRNPCEKKSKLTFLKTDTSLIIMERIYEDELLIFSTQKPINNLPGFMPLKEYKGSTKLH